jgi:hypothetical protein
MFNPVLYCYYDPRSGKFYQLKDDDTSVPWARRHDIHIWGIARWEQQHTQKGNAMGVFVCVSFCIFMEFTTQGGPFQVLLISALLHTSPKRTKKPRAKGGTFLCPVV